MSPKWMPKRRGSEFFNNCITPQSIATHFNFIVARVILISGWHVLPPFKHVLLSGFWIGQMEVQISNDSLYEAFFQKLK